ncbi:uncharacterized protein GGS22DRAFT_117194 [Annulohypoxylon maeteangense]|uniref:uncharacterized protein n=1 Tax=Annulohypoxylon maeteangense TaxID=1927788 RepID=UPI002007410C|nr:uncharacterized protein GGS22DRAFT_117194 [Annulohypoxylon maeteangense]KAI0886745.1 hypothetical protein GGS22DRAFT_117194 [Annulohypoxylon maeteangense]
MAQDDNEPPTMRGSPPEPTETTQQAQTYETFPHPERHSGAKAGAEGAAEEKPTSKPSVQDAFQSIKSDDFFSLHKIPCARQGLMTGIGAGAVVGAGRYITGGRIPKAANWAFGTFFISSIIQWEYCRAQRAKEYASVARMVEIMSQKASERAAKEAEAARLKQEKERQELAKKSWYKLW